MKVGIYTDIHISRNSSIYTGKTGSTYGRIDNLVQGSEYMYNVFKDQGVQYVINGGDTTDSTNLNSEEITGISKFYDNRSVVNYLPEVAILGNHERVDSSGKVNSSQILDLLPNYALVIDPTVVVLDNNIKAYLIPYNIDYDDESMTKVLDDLDAKSRSNDIDVLVVTHNDLQGSYISRTRMMETGISPSVFDRPNIKLVVNGHIHNGSWVSTNVLNLGAFNGLNFSSTHDNWNPSFAIYDTVDKKISMYENPYSLLFRTIKIATARDISTIPNLVDKNSNHKYVLNIRSKYELSDSVRSVLADYDNVVATRIYEEYDKSDDLVSEEYNSTITDLAMSDSINEALVNYLDENPSDKVDNDSMIKFLKRSSIISKKE